MYQEQAPYEGPILELELPTSEDELHLLTWQNAQAYVFDNSEFNYLCYFDPKERITYGLNFNFLGQGLVDSLYDLDFPRTFHPEFRAMHYDWQDGSQSSVLFERLKISPFYKMQPSLNISFEDDTSLNFTWQNSYLRLFKDPQYNHAEYTYLNGSLAVVYNQQVLEHMSQNHYPHYYHPQVDHLTSEWLTDALINEMLCTPGQEIVQKILDSRSET